MDRAAEAKAGCAEGQGSLKQRGFPGDEQSKLDGLGIKTPNLVSWGYVRPGNSLEQLFCVGRFSPQRSEVLYCLCSFGRFGTSAVCSSAQIASVGEACPCMAGTR